MRSMGWRSCTAVFVWLIGAGISLWLVGAGIMRFVYRNLTVCSPSSIFTSLHFFTILSAFHGRCLKSERNKLKWSELALYTLQKNCICIFQFSSFLSLRPGSPGGSTMTGRGLCCPSASSCSVVWVQVVVDVHVRHSESQNEALCLEILSMMRRCLTQQADIRLLLYEASSLLYDMISCMHVYICMILGVCLTNRPTLDSCSTRLVVFMIWYDMMYACMYMYDTRSLPHQQADIRLLLYEACTSFSIDGNQTSLWIKHRW